MNVPSGGYSISPNTINGIKVPMQEPYEIHFIYYVEASTPAEALKKTEGVFPNEYVVTRSE